MRPYDTEIMCGDNMSSSQVLSNIPMVKCSKCKKPLSEACNIEEQNRAPCPGCGSIGRCFEFTLSENIKIEDHVLRRFKHIDPSYRGKKKVRVDQVSGEQLNRGTGKVIRCCDEPLSEHKNRGSANPLRQGGSH